MSHSVKTNLVIHWPHTLISFQLLARSVMVLHAGRPIRWIRSMIHLGISCASLMLAMKQFLLIAPPWIIGLKRGLICTSVVLNMQ